MKEISINQNSSTEKVKFGPVGRDIILNEKIEDETARAIAKETQLEEAIAQAGAVKDVKCDGTSIVVSKVADIGPSIDAKVLVETNRAEAAEAALETGKSNATNIENGSGSGSVQMKSDGGITTFDFTGKNPNATALDPTLTGNIPYGATGQYATSFGGKNAAQGKRASSQGSTTIAKGDYSDASGINSVSLGTGATAQGLSTTAYGQGAHSEGNNTLAIGPFSHTEGRNTITYNEEAHAGGLDSIAARPYSFAHGNYVVAENIAEAVFGQYNNFTGSESYDNNRLFVVGNGQDHTHRSNAFEVYKDGSAKVGKANGSETDLTVATKGYVDAQDANLQEQVNNLKARGRYLSLWNSTTGLPADNPTQLPYTYKAGDYYIIGTVGTGVTLYKPEGTLYTGAASTSEETREVSINDVYYFDGTNWAFQSNAQKEVSFSGLAGNPTDNTALATALNDKVDLTSAQEITGVKTFSNGLSIAQGKNIMSGSYDVLALYAASLYCYTDILPSTYYRSPSLGSSSSKWKDLYLSGKVKFYSPQYQTSIYLSGYNLSLGEDHNTTTVAGRIIPFHDNDSDLGYDGIRWKDLYLSGIAHIGTASYITTDSWGSLTFISDSGTIWSNSDIVPNAGNKKLGTSDNQWSDLYVKNINMTGSLTDGDESQGTAGQVLTSQGPDAPALWQDAAPAPAPSNMVTTDTIQTITGLKTIQTQADGKAIIFTDGSYQHSIYYGSSLTCGTWTFEGKLYPSTNKSYNLGSDSARWGKLYCNGVNTAGSVTPAANGTLYLGSSSWQWKNIYTRGMEIYGGNTTTYPNSPALTFVYNKSDGTTYNNSLTLDSIGSDSLASFRLDGRFSPGADATYSMGYSDLRWKDIYASRNISDGTNSTTVANIAVKSTEAAQQVTGQLKICVVTALPENPDANTLYFIKEA